MEKTEIDAFVSAVVDSTMRTMKRLIEGHTEPVPQIWFLADERGGCAILPVIGLEELFGSIEGKRLIRSAVKSVWAKMSREKPMLKLVAVLLVMDTWVENLPIAEYERQVKAGTRRLLSDRPVGMGEAVVAQVSLLAEEAQHIWNYVRGQDGIVFAPEAKIEVTKSDPDTKGGRLMGLWPL